MADQENLKAIIDGLRCVAGDPMPCTKCHYRVYLYDICKCKCAENAIALLKEQEPRVLTLEEVEKIDGQIYLEYYVNGKAMWAFVWHNKSSTLSFILDGSYEEYIDVFAKSSYGSMWRCWSARPTDAEREAVKWDG